MSCICVYSSGIRDTDMAKESMVLARQNILIQAAKVMLTQANSNQANVISLLQRIYKEEQWMLHYSTLFSSEGDDSMTDIPFELEADDSMTVIPFESEADPFYSDINQARLRQAAKDMDPEKWTAHELLEENDD